MEGSESENGAAPLSVADATGLIAAMASLLNTSTQTILAQLAQNSAGAAERWKIHDAELERNRAAIVARFLVIETALDEHLQVANAHFAKEHDEDIVMDARIRPVKTGAAWLVANWRSILLLLFGSLGFLAVLADLVARYLGGPT